MHMRALLAGYEYQIVESLLAGYMADPATYAPFLPLQISFEQHYFAIALGPQPLPWSRNQADGGLTTGDMSPLWTALVEMGYSIISREVG